jgi:hypothetical protein
MNGTGDHHVKCNKPKSERQISHVFAHMQNLDPPKLIKRRGKKWSG